MFYKPNRVTQAREIHLRFTSIVPDEILRAFTNALAHGNQPAVTIGESEHPWDRIFVYSEDPSDESELIFLPLGYAIDLGRRKTALESAKTFAELEKLHIGTYGDVTSTLEAGANFRDLEEFIDSGECSACEPVLRDDIQDDAERVAHEEEYDRQYAAFLKEAEKEYRSLGPYGMRPPLDEDEFDKDQFDEWSFNYEYDNSSINPKIAMHGLVPDAVEQEFATLEDGVWDGPYVSYQAADKEKIIAALDDLGFLCVEDDYLIEASYWGGGNMGLFEKRAEWFSNVEHLLEGPD